MTELIQKNYDNALVNIAKAIDMAESIENFDGKEFLYVTKGLIYVGKNDLDNALNNFKIADEKNPYNSISKLNIAMLSILRSGKYNTKKLAFCYVPENLCPRLILPAIKPNKAINTDDFKDAIDICDNAIDLNSENAYAYLLKSKLLQLSGNPDYCKYAGNAKDLGIFNAFEELNIECK
jgi:tetratricopeptide (TPR) repeat protein